MRSSAIIFTLLLVGCCPCRSVISGTTDSTRLEIRERVVKVRDTVRVELPAERIEVITPDTTSTVETSIATSTAIVSKGQLSHSIENKKVSWSRPTEVIVEVKDSIIFRDRKITKVVEVERELTWWQQAQIKGFWALAAILAVFVAWKLRKPLMELLKI